MSAPAPYTAPGYGSVPKKEKKEEPPAYSPPTESAPVYSTGSMFDSSLGKLLLVLLVVGLVFMFLIVFIFMAFPYQSLKLAFAFCLVGAIKYKEAKHIALMINITCSTFITGLLIFWLYRGVLTSSLIWYIFAQCIFLFFQLVTTDIFAWYVTGGAPPTPATTLVPPTNCSNRTHNCTLYSQDSYDVPISF